MSTTTPPNPSTPPAPKYPTLGLDASKHPTFHSLDQHFAENPLPKGEYPQYNKGHNYSKFHTGAEAHTPYEYAKTHKEELDALVKQAAESKDEATKKALGEQITELKKAQPEVGRQAHGALEATESTLKKAHGEVQAAYKEAKEGLAKELKAAGSDAKKLEAVTQKTAALEQEFAEVTKGLGEHQKLINKARAEITEITGVKSIEGKEAGIAVQESKAASAAASGRIGSAFKNVGANWEAGGGARWKAGIGSVVALGFGLDGSKKVLRGLGVLPKGHNPDGSEKNEGGVFIGSAEIAAAVAALMVAGKGAAR
jgi:hypothetical protein